MSNRIILAVSAATLAVTVAAGVYAGSGVVSGPVAGAAPLTGNQPAYSVERRDAGSHPAVTDAHVVALAPSPTTPAPASISLPEARPSPIARPSTAEAEPNFHEIALPLATAPLVRHPTSTTAVPSAAATPSAPQRSGCDEDGYLCLAPRVDVAEQRVASAYEQAVRAGVRSRDLRGYRGAWDRARGMAVKQPRDALRQYAMITSDLLNLADDAEARYDAAGQ